ncbi:MAG: hypothetical protein EA398_11435 [Deltaproteobacteria bacterium]|nr:MAG: hypothetical protein EA398_11435 [Deltaproteobacteria bacterium]
MLILALGGPPGCTGQGDRAESPDGADSPGLHPAAQPATPPTTPPGPDALRGHWTSLDPLGIEHGLHIDWPRLRWFVDHQLVRDERCDIHEHRAANLWVRCVPASDEPAPSDDAPQIERGLTIEDGELVLLPLVETRWQRQPEQHRPDGTELVGPADPGRTP